MDDECGPFSWDCYYQEEVITTSEKLFDKILNQNGYMLTFLLCLMFHI